ncbi:MAG TPA: S8 family serine peptidase [Vicinamibacterales bacterium]|nr:S8 family serine peptidase [Vicinamibacterales bacterium]
MSDTVTIDVAKLAAQTGRGVRVAVIDSGVHASHPHVGGLVEGASVGPDGDVREGDAEDRLGHGTAVAAAIHEKAPGAAIVPVRVFDRELTATIDALVSAIRWAAGARAALINLSLGTLNPAHADRLRDAIAAASNQGAVVVAAAPDPDHPWLPGGLAGVFAVELDWACPRDRCEVAWMADSASVRIRASGFPRPIPGVPPERNLRGVSFAVANATGLLARAIEGVDSDRPSRLVAAFVAMRDAARRGHRAPQL